VALIPGSGEAEAPVVVDTLGGRMHVRWDSGAAATPHGQLVFFAEFLAATGVFERWVSACPLEHRSGNAPDKRDVLGTLMLGLLAGHRRFAHITALRGDAVATLETFRVGCMGQLEPSRMGGAVQAVAEVLRDLGISPAPEQQAAASATA